MKNVITNLGFNKFHCTLVHPQLIATLVLIIFYAMCYPYGKNRAVLSSVFAKAAEAPPDASQKMPHSYYTYSKRKKIGELIPKRVILSYPLEGCVDTRSSNSPIVQGRNARDSTIRQLQEKVAEYLHVKVMEHVSKTSDCGTLQGYQKRHSEQSLREVPLNTRYLEALQMEVIKSVPSGVDDTILCRLAQSLPCVEAAYEDSNNYGIPEDPIEVDMEDPGVHDIGNNDSVAGRVTLASAAENIGLHISSGSVSAKQESAVGSTSHKVDRTIEEPEMAHAEVDSTPQTLEGWKRFLRSNSEKYRGLDSFSLGNSVIRSYHSSPKGSCRDGQHKCTEMTPNDPFFTRQWNLKSRNEGGIEAEHAWSLWTGLENSMVVAVIDSGCDMAHNDLKNRKWINPGETCGDGIDNDNNGLIDDCHGYDFVNDTGDVIAGNSGHGTGASGIIAAEPNNLLGLTGICWGCTIMCLKFIGGGKGTVSNQVQAIDYAVRMGAWVSNNSYGGYGYSEMEYQAIKRAKHAGHLFVASAGNHNLNTDLPQNDHTPSGYQLDNIISVGATNRQNRKATFSNSGVKSVDVMAPGNAVHTTAANQTYAAVSGTSFAAPHVAGVAALIWSGFPSLSYLQIKEALIRGSDKYDILRRHSVSGGRINLYGGLYIAAKMTLGEDYAREARQPSFQSTAGIIGNETRGTEPAQEDEWKEDWLQSIAYGGSSNSHDASADTPDQNTPLHPLGIANPFGLGSVLNNLLSFNKMSETRPGKPNLAKLQGGSKVINEYLKSLENASVAIQDGPFNFFRHNSPASNSLDNSEHRSISKLARADKKASSIFAIKPPNSVIN